MPFKRTRRRRDLKLQDLIAVQEAMLRIRARHTYGRGSFTRPGNIVDEAARKDHQEKLRKACKEAKHEKARQEEASHTEAVDEALQTAREEAVNAAMDVLKKRFDDFFEGNTWGRTSYNQKSLAPSPKDFLEKKGASPKVSKGAALSPPNLVIRAAPENKARAKPSDHSGLCHVAEGPQQKQAHPNTDMRDPWEHHVHARPETRTFNRHWKKTAEQPTPAEEREEWKASTRTPTHSDGKKTRGQIAVEIAEAINTPISAHETAGLPKTSGAAPTDMPEGPPEDGPKKRSGRRVHWGPLPSKMDN